MQLRRSVVLLAATLAACGSSEAPPTTAASSPPVTSAPATPTTPTTDPAPPASAVTAPAPRVAAELPGPAIGGPTSGPAFAVYVSTGFHDYATLVVPVDPATPARAVGSLLVLDDRTAPPELRWWVTESDWPHPCDCDCPSARPPAALITLAPDARDLLPAGGCFVPSGERPCEGEEEVEDEDEDEDEDEGEDNDEDEDEGECDTAVGDIATIVGGTAFTPLDTHYECHGWNRYNVDLAVDVLVGGAPWPPPALPARGVTCTSNAFGPGWPLLHEVTPLACTHGRRGWRATDPNVDCSDCDLPFGALVVPRITRGALRLVAAYGTDDASVDVWVADVPLTAATCPSSADPCGSSRRFAPIVDADDFWVATDGTAALAIRDHGATSTLTLHAPDTAEPVRTLDIPFGAGDVISVRFHHDVALLAQRIDRGMPSHDERPCRAPDASIVAPPPLPPVAPAPASCEPGRHRGVSGACEPIALAPEDEGFVDPRGGREWGNRCALHLRAGALDAAEAACARGLLVADRDATWGALYYNLGRIAEQRGDVETARARYRSSLERRPGNAAVQAALDALP